MTHRIESAPKIPVDDLMTIPRYQVLIECALPLTWLLGSWLAYASPIWLFGPLFSFMFFLCALRLNHEAMHNNLGVSRRWDSAIMHGLSALMLGSNHADAFCHLQHHRDPLGPQDHEGHCAKMSWHGVLRYGPRFQFDLNRAAWRQGTGFWRRRILVDWALIVAFVALCLLTQSRFLMLHLLAMIFAQSVVAFFCGVDYASRHNWDWPCRTQPTRPDCSSGLFDVSPSRASPFPQCPGLSLARVSRPP